MRILLIIMMLRQYCLLAGKADHRTENTLGVISLDVSLQVSFLSEGVLTILADMGSLSCMFLHVDLKSARCQINSYFLLYLT